MKKITTVTGDITPEELGVTSIHEHTLQKMTPVYDSVAAFKGALAYWGLDDDGSLVLPGEEQLEVRLENLGYLRSGWAMLSGIHGYHDDKQLLIDELKAFKKAGGNTICDCSPTGSREEFIQDIKEASILSGVNIIICTGIYVAAFQPESMAKKSCEELAAFYEQEAANGIAGTGVRPGFVKAALQTITEDDEIHPLELKSLRAAAKAAAKLNMPLTLHVIGMDQEKLLQISDILLDECGMKPENVLLAHMDLAVLRQCKITDYVTDFETATQLVLEPQRKMLDLGFNISYDNWGSITMAPFEVANVYNPTDFDKLRALDILLKEGYASRIMLGQDSMGKINSVSGGGYGYTRILTFVKPMLENLGYSKEVIDMLFVKNPAQFLAY